MNNKFIIPLIVIMFVMIAGFGLMALQIKINNSQMLMSMQAYVNTIRNYAISTGGDSKASGLEVFDPESAIKIDLDDPATIKFPCTDSDGGDVPEVWGYVEYRDRQFADECYASSTTNLLIENFCYMGNPVARLIDCKEGCVGGACYTQ